VGVSAGSTAGTSAVLAGSGATAADFTASCGTGGVEAQAKPKRHPPRAIEIENERMARGT
jgi:hypothetical protein